MAKLLSREYIELLKTYSPGDLTDQDGRDLLEHIDALTQENADLHARIAGYEAQGQAQAERIAKWRERAFPIKRLTDYVDVDLPSDK